MILGSLCQQLYSKKPGNLGEGVMEELFVQPIIWTMKLAESIPVGIERLTMS